jgi:branched-chain amino acid transport system ATP-binding protein
MTDQLFQLLRGRADAGAAVLVVEQHPVRALEVADRALVLKHGRLVFEARASEIRDRIDELERAYLR